MMYNADFLIAAVVILLLVLRNFLDQKRAEDLNSRIFLFFAVIGILDVIAELVSNYYITSGDGDFGLAAVVTTTIFYLFQALPKGERMEYVIQKAVELGVHEIIPVTMKYCVVKLDEKKAKKKQERWQAIAESAAKQAKRSRIPEIKPVMSYKEAVAYAKQCKIQFVPYENERGMQGTKEALAGIQPGDSISVMIGPEGGFSEEEIAYVRDEMQVISLGKRILRTDTAAITMMSMLMLEIEMKADLEEEKKK